MGRLIKDTILESLGRRADIPHIELALEELDDSAVFNGVVFTTDSYVVKPLFFSGQDIGSLAVVGTINDLSVVGADPAAITCAIIIQEGFAAGGS